MRRFVWAAFPSLVALACGGGGTNALDGGVDAEIDGAADAQMDAQVDAPPFVASCAPEDGCDPVAQECPENEGCYPTTEGALACRPRGVASAGTSCVRDVDCRPGLFCDEAEVCARFCCPASTGGCLPGDVCVGFEGVLHGACRPGCDATTQLGCAEGEACYPTDARGTAACLEAGASPADAACVRANDCASGLACLSVEDADPRCIRLCQNDDDCDGDTRCVSLGGTVAVCE